LKLPFKLPKLINLKLLENKTLILLIGRLTLTILIGLFIYLFLSNSLILLYMYGCISYTDLVYITGIYPTSCFINQIDKPYTIFYHLILPYYFIKFTVLLLLYIFLLLDKSFHYTILIFILPVFNYLIIVSGYSDIISNLVYQPFLLSLSGFLPLITWVLHTTSLYFLVIALLSCIYLVFRKIF